MNAAQGWSRRRKTMSCNRLMSMLWLFVATLYSICAFVALVTGKNQTEYVVHILLALVLMKLYDMDGDE